MRCWPRSLSWPGRWSGGRCDMGDLEDWIIGLCAWGVLTALATYLHHVTSLGVTP